MSDSYCKLCKENSLLCLTQVRGNGTKIFMVVCESSKSSHGHGDMSNTKEGAIEEWNKYIEGVLKDV